MEQDYPTTPFGRRTMSLGMVASQVLARECPEDKPAHKWKVFRSITECKAALGVTDRALAVLNALLTCLPETAMTVGPELTVFPSNAQLSLRTHGMTDSTLRRHLAALVDAQLIIRRDSPNGKRYVRRGQGGEIEQAFGFDLTPVLARAEEFERLANEARLSRRDAMLAREKITILRRDIAKMIMVGLHSGITANWETLQTAFQALSGRLPRIVTSELLSPLAEDLHALAVRIGNLLEGHVKTQNLDGNDTQNDAHLQNSRTEPSIELEPASENSLDDEPKPTPETSRQPRGLPLSVILKACPDISMYDRDKISTWQGLISTAGLVRGALGISLSAWDEARAAMGEIEAAITIAGILQRAEEIKNPGGYLRGLTDRSKQGRYSTGPMVMSLMRKQMKAEKTIAMQRRP